MAPAEEIVVTARRREETLQDVPISITAISGDALEQKNITNMQQLQYQVPSLQISTNTTLRDSISFALRGQRIQESQLLSDPPVGLYFAEVVQPRSYGFGYALYDLENVQVLKGVQGTLFGRNMTGGAVLIEPKKPTSEFEAEVKAEAGNYSMWSTYGMVNVPLVQDKLALRMNGIIKQRDGFTINNATGRDYDNLNYWSGRGSVLFTPTDNFESVTIFDILKSRDNGTGAVLTYYRRNANAEYGTPAVVNIGGANLDRLDRLYAQQLAFGPRRVVGSVFDGNSSKNPFPGQDSETITWNYGITNKSVLEVGDLRFKNIFGYRHIDYRRRQDFYHVPVNLITAIGNSRISQYSEEFQIEGKAFDDRFTWTTGLFGFIEAGREMNVSVQFAELAPSPIATAATQFSNGVAISYAVFGAGEFRLTDRWTLSGGLRWNHDQRSVETTNKFQVSQNCRLTGPGLPNPQCEMSNGDAWRSVTWDVTLRFEPDPTTTIYAAERKGFRAGGFGLRGTTFADLTPFAPEFVRETEIGAKKQFDLNGARLTTNAALFHQNVTNQQVQVPTLVGGTVATIIVNTAAVKNYGGELEATLSLPFGLDMSGYYSFVNNGDLKGQSGYALRGIPKHALGLSTVYTLPFDESVGVVTLGADVSYRSNIHLDDLDPNADQNGYGLTNLNLNWAEVYGTGLGLGLFANNVFDRTYRTGVVALDNSVGLTGSVYGEPRMYGGSVSYKF